MPFSLHFKLEYQFWFILNRTVFKQKEVIKNQIKLFSTESSEFVVLGKFVLKNTPDGNEFLLQVFFKTQFMLRENSLAIN